MDILKLLAQKILGNQQGSQQIISPIPPNQAQGYVGVPSPDKIKEGLLKFNPQTPMASESANIYQAMGKMKDNPNVDPTLVLTRALAETGGGMDFQNRDTGKNNLYNTMPGGKLINYPDMKTAMLGGDNPEYGTQSHGFVNLILKSPAYAKYRQTGNIDDLNAVFSPPNSGNPSLDKQRQNMEALRRYFQ